MDILYHYCSSDVFHSIVESHSIWLSSLSLSNDTMEGKLVTEAVARLAGRDGLDQSASHRLQEMVGAFEHILDGLGFCLSEEGDLLSQWRGYAADATGISIGFSRQYLDWLAEQTKGKNTSGFALMKVQYDPQAHETEVAPTYKEAKRLIEAGAFKSSGTRSLLGGWTDDQVEQERRETEKLYKTLSFTMLMLFTKLFLLKSPGFHEEKEWRLLSYLHRGGQDTSFHRAVRDRLIPYRSYKLIQTPERQPIAEVILGSKHLSPIKVIEDFVKQNGYCSVRVKRSEAAYR